MFLLSKVTKAAELFSLSHHGPLCGPAKFLYVDNQAAPLWFKLGYSEIFETSWCVKNTMNAELNDIREWASRVSRQMIDSESEGSERLWAMNIQQR